jgi:hypothetical protein
MTEAPNYDDVPADERALARRLAQIYTDGSCDLACGAICDCGGREPAYAYRAAHEAVTILGRYSLPSWPIGACDD